MLSRQSTRTTDRSMGLLACRAPHLFAGLLRRAGVAPALLPLLAEPARAAVQGLAVTARRKRPAHIAAFLAALREICSGAASDAAAVSGAALSLPPARCSSYKKSLPPSKCQLVISGVTHRLKERKSGGLDVQSNCSMLSKLL